MSLESVDLTWLEESISGAPVSTGEAEPETITLGAVEGAPEAQEAPEVSEATLDDDGPYMSDGVVKALEEPKEEPKEGAEDPEDDEKPVEDDPKEGVEKDGGRMFFSDKKGRRLLRLQTVAKEVLGATTYKDMFEGLESLKSLKPILEQGIPDEAAAKEMVEASQAYKEIIADLNEGTEESTLRHLGRIHEANPQALERMADVFPKVLKEANPQAFRSMVTPIYRAAVKGHVEQMYATAREIAQSIVPGTTPEERTRREELAEMWAAAAQFAEYAASGGKIRPRDEIWTRPPQQPTQDDPVKQELEARRRADAERVQQEFISASNDLKGAFEADRDSRIEAYLGDLKGKVSEKTFAEFVTKVRDAVTQDIRDKGARDWQLLVQEFERTFKGGNYRDKTTFVEKHGNIVNKSLSRLSQGLKKEIYSEAVRESKAKLAQAKDAGKVKALTASSSKSSGSPSGVTPEYRKGGMTVREYGASLAEQMLTQPTSSRR